jgi:hypothetical protein
VLDKIQRNEFINDHVTTAIRYLHLGKNKHKIIQTKGLNFKFPYSSHVTGMFMIKNESIIICSKHVECIEIYPKI